MSHPVGVVPAGCQSWHRRPVGAAVGRAEERDFPTVVCRYARLEVLDDAEYRCWPVRQRWCGLARRNRRGTCQGRR